MGTVATRKGDSPQVRRQTKDTALHAADPWLQIAVRYLARFDRTQRQVEQFLRVRGASPVQADRAIGRLVTLRYLDDRAYAKRWIETRLARRPMGRERLRVELLAKGINEVLAEDAIRKALTEADEETLARRALGIRQRRSRRLSPQQAFRLLRQWGFEEDTIARIIGKGEDTEGP
ncbi:MAG: hypothetical protein GDA67_04925 [Nitrospira sp. CR1.3]|nr:hypothetical protein [Nitrospira sp. CR1.3]